LFKKQNQNGDYAATLQMLLFVIHEQ